MLLSNRMWRWGGYWVVAQIKAYKANNM